MASTSGHGPSKAKVIDTIEMLAKTLLLPSVDPPADISTEVPDSIRVSRDASRLIHRWFLVQPASVLFAPYDIKSLKNLTYYLYLRMKDETACHTIYCGFHPVKKGYRAALACLLRLACVLITELPGDKCQTGEIVKQKAAGIAEKGPHALVSTRKQSEVFDLALGIISAIVHEHGPDSAYFLDGVDDLISHDLRDKVTRAMYRNGENKTWWATSIEMDVPCEYEEFAKDGNDGEWIFGVIPFSLLSSKSTARRIGEHIIRVKSIKNFDVGKRRLERLTFDQRKEYPAQIGGESADTGANDADLPE
ncbi:hypothetical protein F5Y18DRAFT_440835 [Xylariaceae sp. FL1019]|nr:hypothetical protein F5Y18DRAFT_440835 [Xylariaceae sp. FL1019]